MSNKEVDVKNIFLNLASANLKVYKIKVANFYFATYAKKIAHIQAQHFTPLQIIITNRNALINLACEVIVSSFLVNNVCHSTDIPLHSQSPSQMVGVIKQLIEKRAFCTIIESTLSNLLCRIVA
jgi:hypothetical protein